MRSAVALFAMLAAWTAAAKVSDEALLARVSEIVAASEPELTEFMRFAWRLAYAHVTNCAQAACSPYMDEAFAADRIWVWDTCFMVHFCKYCPDLFPGVESLDNFYAPMVEGCVTPLKIHIPDNPPLFAWAEQASYRQTGDRRRLDRVFRVKRYPQRLYDIFEDFKTGDFKPYQTSIFPVMWERRPLGYLWSGGRSGMDNTPRGDFGADVQDNDVRYFKVLWVDAVSQQALSCRIIYEVTGDETYKRRFDEFSRLINERYWDEADGCYYDIESHAPHQCVKVLTPASYWPLLASVVPHERAKRLVSHLTNDAELGGTVPFPSVSRSSRHFDPSGRYWRGAVWLPTAYMILQALEENGFGELADDLGTRLVRHMCRTWREYEPHTIWECYSPTEPKPSTNRYLTKMSRPDFCGWSALGPINVTIENVLGIRVDGVAKTVRWRVHRTDRHGVKRLQFGGVTATLVYDNGVVEVEASAPFSLEIRGRTYHVPAGTKRIFL